jgi:hypothetical protein
MRVTSSDLFGFTTVCQLLVDTYTAKAILYRRIDLGRQFLTGVVGGSLSILSTWFPTESVTIVSSMSWITVLLVCLDMIWSLPTRRQAYELTVWQILDIVNSIEADRFDGQLDHMLFGQLHKKLLVCKMNVGDSTVTANMYMNETLDDINRNLNYQSPA